MNRTIKHATRGSAMTNTHGPVLQRACACGGHSHAGGECESCRKKRESREGKLQRAAVNEADVTEVPEIVYDVLRSTGHPLDRGTRAFMEPRFGHDFGGVRIHTDSRAAESAAAVNALAYTVGRDVVFGEGQYAPGSSAGQRLLAHELTHVVQQSSGDMQFRGKLKLGADDDPYEHQANAVSDLMSNLSESSPQAMLSASLAVQRACGPTAIGAPSACTQVGGDVAGERFLFKINCDDFINPAEQTRLELFADTIAEGERIEVHGYASQDGDPTFNENLSCARALKTQSIIHTVLVTKGISASVNVFMHGANPGSVAAEQRSVVIDRSGLVHPSAPPTHVCGPDVATQVVDAVSKTNSTFASWSPTDKAAACDALISFSTGAYAWDINELHNNGWILSYRPACASAGATPACGSSVKMHSDCHYAGSVNYVIFGAMCKSCHDHFTAIGSAEASNFTLAEMLYWINFYKGTGPLGLSTPSANFGPSTAWATAGYNGWPSVSDPSGDRLNCAPMCPTPYSGSSFLVHWVPKGWF